MEIKAVDHSVNIVGVEKNGRKYAMCVAWATQVAEDKLICAIGPQSATGRAIAAGDLLALIKVSQRFRSCKFRSRIAFLLLGKHKFQVYLVVGIVVRQYPEIGALRMEILEVLADLYNLVNGSFKLFLPRKILLVKLPFPVALAL